MLLVVVPSVVGSLPLPHDVRVLWEVHRVGAVVNMTEEYHGTEGGRENRRTTREQRPPHS